MLNSLIISLFDELAIRDAVITCVVNTLTCLLAGVVTFSILGNIAELTQSDIESVVSSGPGLVFITYPQVVLQLPGAPIWAILFFAMLLVSVSSATKKDFSRR